MKGIVRVECRVAATSRALETSPAVSRPCHRPAIRSHLVCIMPSFFSNQEKEHQKPAAARGGSISAISHLYFYASLFYAKSSLWLLFDPLAWYGLHGPRSKTTPKVAHGEKLPSKSMSSRVLTQCGQSQHSYWLAANPIGKTSPPPVLKVPLSGGYLLIFAH